MGDGAAAWEQTAARLAQIGGVSDGNELTLYVDGDAAFDAILAAIAHARRRVWFETYIFEPDALGHSVLDALVAAARRHVEVRLLVDAIGSANLDEDHLAPLRAAGAHVERFNPLLLWRRRLPARMRDHRKILVVDDEFGFCGGMNVAVEYGGPRRGNDRFRDTHLLAHGPAAHDLALLFASGWQHACGRRLQPGPAVTPRADGVRVQVLGSDQRRRRRQIQRALHRVVATARERVWLTSPYFVPPPALRRALVQAARRGVDVQVLTAGISDVPIATDAARHLYGTLLEAGVRIWELVDKTLHAKTSVVDGHWASVGSFNLDRWSYEQNLEVSAVALDVGMASALESVFVGDLGAARAVDQDAWRARSTLQRLRGWVAYQLARV